MATKSNPRKDLNQSAFAIMQQATSEVLPEPIEEKKKTAQESGRRGGLKGGAARASKLTPEQRSEIAKNAAKKRWKTKQNANDSDAIATPQKRRRVLRPPLG